MANHVVEVTRLQSLFQFFFSGSSTFRVGLGVWGVGFRACRQFQLHAHNCTRLATPKLRGGLDVGGHDSETQETVTPNHILKPEALHPKP